MRDREKLGKFDAQSDEGIFLGYSTDNKTFRVYNLRTHSVMEFVNVVVDENSSNDNDTISNEFYESVLEQDIADVQVSSQTNDLQDFEEQKEEE